MLRSFLFALSLTLVLALGAIGCSSGRPTKPPLPIVTVRTATMDITPGIEVLTHVALPNGFKPSTDYPPMWLQSGQEVAIAGTRNGRATIIGYSGDGYRTERVIAEDGGIGAPDGKILDFASNADGMVLALAVAEANQPQLDVITRDVISAGAASPVSSFDGVFQSVSIGWLGDFAIPLALQAHEAEAPPRDRMGFVNSPPPPASGASSGLYTINVSGAVTTGYLKLNCRLSRLSWSPDGIVAVGAGDAKALPIVVNRAKESCQQFNAKAPIQVLDWQPDSKAFLYQENGPNGPAIYRYDLGAMRRRLVAISSGAAIFVGNDQILALGNSDLTFREAQFSPSREIRAELALSDASGGDTDVQSLGFNTTAPLLAASTMTYAHPTDTAAIATFSPGEPAPMRKVVIYSVASKKAFLVAFGLARGGISMSWSPRGRYLAISDGDATSAALTILAPPQ
jgi:hypothetical protein